MVCQPLFSPKRGGRIDESVIQYRKITVVKYGPSEVRKRFW